MRDQIMAKIRRNIQESGRHIYSIMGGESPGYLYTIGTWRKADAELVLAGCSLLARGEAADLVNRVAEKLESGEEPTEISEQSSVGSFTLRRVHHSWASEMLLGALDYYEIPSIAAWQLILDEKHRTIDQPDMSRPYSPTEHRVWRWLQGGWPHPLDSGIQIVTNRDALLGYAVSELFRWEPLEWEMFSGSGEETPREELFVVPLATLLAFDPSLGAALHVPVGEGLFREFEDDGTPGPWQAWRRRER